MKRPNETNLSQTPISRIREWIEVRPDEGRLALIEADPRRGVQVLVQKIRRRLARAKKERDHQKRLLEIEGRLRAQGVGLIAGVDEAGRGPIAGPVVAAAVILPPHPDLLGLDDSKKLRPDVREVFFNRIREQALASGVGISDSFEIDRLNILQASLKAMREALSALGVIPDRVLVDGKQLPGSGLPELAFVDGDARSLSIAAASVIAKVTRDRMMSDYDRAYPGYGFAGNKGYASRGHLKAVRDMGTCPIHRISFGSLRKDQAEIDFETDEPKQVGERGEEIAVSVLEKKGFSILERNFRDGGEIDVIATKGSVISFVEVKTDKAGGFGDPAARVDNEKQIRLARTAERFLAQRDFDGLEPRFDVIAVRLKGKDFEADHIEGAFMIRNRLA